MTEQLFGVEDAAKKLAISPWTLRAYIQRGTVRTVRIGRRVLLSADELRRIVEHGSEPGRRTKTRLGTVTRRTMGEADASVEATLARNHQKVRARGAIRAGISLAD